MNREGLFGIPGACLPGTRVVCLPLTLSLLLLLLLLLPPLGEDAPCVWRCAVIGCVAGFLALYLLGAGLARTLRLTPIRRLAPLVGAAAACGMVFWALGGPRGSSRRLMNSGYVVWVAGHCAALLLAGALVEQGGPRPRSNLLSRVGHWALTVFLMVGVGDSGSVFQAAILCIPLPAKNMDRNLLSFPPHPPPFHAHPILCAWAGQCGDGRCELGYGHPAHQRQHCCQRLDGIQCTVLCGRTLRRRGGPTTPKGAQPLKRTPLFAARTGYIYT
jgi:hypothetical protein